MLKWLKNNLPNGLTLFNASCGVLGVFLLSTHGLQSPISITWLIAVAGIADFFDGFLARLLGSASNLGKDLDSLADSITFGLLPGHFLFLYLNHFQEVEWWKPEYAYAAVLIPVFSIIRLAIFNNDTRQSDQFIGVPTPANAIFLIFLLEDQLLLGESAFVTPALALALAFGCAVWLVAPIPLIAMKFKNFNLGDNLARYSLVGICLVLLVFAGKSAIPYAVLAYIALSIIVQLFSKPYDLQSQS